MYSDNDHYTIYSKIAQKYNIRFEDILYCVSRPTHRLLLFVPTLNIIKYIPTCVYPQSYNITILWYGTYNNNMTYPAGPSHTVYRDKWFTGWRWYIKNITTLPPTKFGIFNVPTTGCVSQGLWSLYISICEPIFYKQRYTHIYNIVYLQLYTTSFRI